MIQVCEPFVTEKELELATDYLKTRDGKIECH